MGFDLGRIVAEIREAAELCLRPRFRALAPGEVWEKAPGEVVTLADQECERVLGAALRGAVPGSSLIGEEAAAMDPSQLAKLSADEPVWLLDPLDGTSAFASGSPDYGVMAALVADGATVLSVIHQPELDRTFVAELGSGAWEVGAGTRLAVPPRPGPLRGSVMRRFLPDSIRAAVDGNEFRFTTLVPRTGAACIEYPALANGERDFMLYWRTLPWDHAPGALLLREAGGVAAHLDGATYDPKIERAGLLVAGGDETWHAAKHQLGV